MSFVSKKHGRYCLLFELHGTEIPLRLLAQSSGSGILLIIGSSVKINVFFFYLLELLVRRAMFFQRDLLTMPL